MICDTVEELTPIIGTRPACRALGASPATIYRRRDPPAPRRPGRGRRRPGRSREPSARRCWPSCTASASSTLAPRRCTRPCSTRAATSLGADDVPAARRQPRRRARAARPAHPPRLREARAARHRPERALEWDISKLLGAGEVDVLLPVRDPRRVQPLRRRLDGPATRDRAARRGADRADGRTAASSRALTVHADRGSSMRTKPVAFLLADLGVTKTHSRPYTSSDNPSARRSSRR